MLSCHIPTHPASCTSSLSLGLSGTRGGSSVCQMGEAAGLLTELLIFHAEAQDHLFPWKSNGYAQSETLILFLMRKKVRHNLCPFVRWSPELWPGDTSVQSFHMSWADCPSQPLRKLRQEDCLSPVVQHQPGQHSEAHLKYLLSSL